MFTARYELGVCLEIVEFYALFWFKLWDDFDHVIVMNCFQKLLCFGLSYGTISITLL